MKLEPIQKQRVYQIIIEQLKASIEKGDLKPGDRLPSERDLAESLAVSRSAIREAFSVLEASRLIRVSPGVGVFLVEDVNNAILSRLNEILSPREIDYNLIQLLEVRQPIESQAAYLAAMRHSETDLQMIRQAYYKLAESVEADQLGAEEDYQFHMAIVAAAHNVMMSEVVKLFSDRCLEGLYISRSESIHIPGKRAIVLAEHEQIMLAIEEKDAEKAQNAMWQHLSNVKSRYSL